MRLPIKAVYILLSALFALTSLAQKEPPQSIPDAPSATRPPQPQFPQGTTARQPGTTNEQPPAAPPSDGKTDDKTGDKTDDKTAFPENAPPPSSSTNREPSGPRPMVSDANQDQLKTYKTTVNFVVVPVTVKDGDGRQVPGLLQGDFAIYENGEPQQIRFFTSDAFPLSAAVVVDLSQPDSSLRKVNSGLSAIQGAFSQYDEVAFFTYGNSVQRVLDFNAIGDRTSTAIAQIKRQQGRTSADMGGGPMAAGPTVNGRAVDPSKQAGIDVPIIPREPHVLNDAILAAANDLMHRPLSRRKVILVISDGREERSNASYSDVLRVLLSNEITVYAIAVDSAAIPVLNRIDRLHLPRLGYSNILPKYASATGGDVFSEFSRDAIERSYQIASEEARNQYTLGYSTRATLADNYRTIEIRVKRPNLKVFAKDGYYPLPPPKKP